MSCYLIHLTIISISLNIYAHLVQQVEHTAVNRNVIGSSPIVSAICFRSSVGRVRDL